MGAPIPQFILDLMPDAEEAQHQEALENVRCYLRIVATIHARLRQEALAGFDKNPESSQTPEDISH